MAALPHPTRTAPRLYTAAEYLELEYDADERHQWMDGVITRMGDIVGMAGGTHDHSLIIANVIREVGNRLKGTPCRVYDANLRVRDRRTTVYTYPDATVICGPAEFDPEDRNRTTVLNPKLVIEVLSPSSEADDRGAKFERYRESDSLEEYVLVSQRVPLVETFQKPADGMWRFDWTRGLEGAVPLRSLGIELPMAEIFAGVTFPTAGNAADDGAAAADD